MTKGFSVNQIFDILENDFVGETSDRISTFSKDFKKMDDAKQWEIVNVIFNEKMDAFEIMQLIKTI